MEKPTLLTCSTCGLLFHDVDLHTQHYKSEWHRYNLKRKVAGFLPIKDEEFQKLLLSYGKIDNKLSSNSVYCKECKKSFNTQNSYDNHLNSKKHNSNVVNAGKSVGKNAAQKSKVGGKNNSNSEIEVDSDDEWVEDPIIESDCLFCNHPSDDLTSNLIHMRIEHSFFIPDLEYCIDLEGLLVYLGEKITNHFICIWCNERGKTFHSADSVQKHMMDKGHCKMLHEGIALAEYADYYDYSSSYPDQPEEDADPDSEVSVPVIDDTDYQLTLPSGVVVGHRSLMRYYKQSIDPNRSTVPVAENRKLHKVLAHYKALGWTTSEQQSIAKKAKDLHFMKRVQAKSNMRLGVKANKLQKKYRVQVLF